MSGNKTDKGAISPYYLSLYWKYTPIQLDKRKQLES